MLSRFNLAKTSSSMYLCGTFRRDLDRSDARRSWAVVSGAGLDPLQNGAVLERVHCKTETAAVRDLEGRFLQDQAFLGMRAVESMGVAGSDRLVVQFRLVAKE